MTEKKINENGYKQLINDLKRDLQIVDYPILLNSEATDEDLDNAVQAIFRRHIGNEFFKASTFPKNAEEEDLKAVRAVLMHYPILENALNKFMAEIEKHYSQYSFSCFYEYIIDKFLQCGYTFNRKPSITTFHFLPQNGFKIELEASLDNFYRISEDGSLNENDFLSIEGKIFSTYRVENGNESIEKLYVTGSYYLLKLVEAAVLGKTEDIELFWRIIEFRKLLLVDLLNAKEKPLAILHTCITEWISIQRVYFKKLGPEEQVKIFSPSSAEQTTPERENNQGHSRSKSGSYAIFPPHHRRRRSSFSINREDLRETKELFLAKLFLAFKRVYDEIEDDYYRVVDEGDAQRAIEVNSLRAIIRLFKDFFEEMTTKKDIKNVPEHEIKYVANSIRDYLEKSNTSSINYILENRYSTIDNLEEFALFLVKISETISKSRTPKGSQSPELLRTEFFTRHIDHLLAMHAQWLKQKEWSDDEGKSKLEAVIYPYILSCINDLNIKNLIHVVEEYLTYCILNPGHYEENVKTKSFAFFVYYYKNLLIGSSSFSTERSKAKSYRASLLEKISYLKDERFKKEFAQVEQQALAKAIALACFERDSSSHPPISRLYFAERAIKTILSFPLLSEHLMEQCRMFQSEKEIGLSSFFDTEDGILSPDPSSLIGLIELSTLLNSPRDSEKYEELLDSWRENVHTILADIEHSAQWPQLIDTFEKLTAEIDYYLLYEERFNRVQFLKTFRFELSLLIELSECQIKLNEKPEEEFIPILLSFVGLPYAEMLKIEITDPDDPLSIIRAIGDRIPRVAEYLNQHQTTVIEQVKSHPLLTIKPIRELGVRDIDFSKIKEELSPFQINWFLYRVLPRLMTEINLSLEPNLEMEPVLEMIRSLDSNYLEGELLLTNNSNQSSINAKTLFYISLLQSFLSAFVPEKNESTEFNRVFGLKIFSELKFQGPEVNRLFLESTLKEALAFLKKIEMGLEIPQEEDGQYLSELKKEIQNVISLFKESIPELESAILTLNQKSEEKIETIPEAIKSEYRSIQIILNIAFNEAIGFFKHLVLDSEDHSFSAVHQTILGFVKTKEAEEFEKKLKPEKSYEKNMENKIAMGIEHLQDWTIQDCLNALFLLSGFSMPTKEDIKRRAISIFIKNAGNNKREVMERITEGIITKKLEKDWKELLSIERQQANSPEKKKASDSEASSSTESKAPGSPE